MAARIGPKKVHRHFIEFKIEAVRLSLHPEIQTQDAAHAMDIHRFMQHQLAPAACPGAAAHGEGRRARVMQDIGQEGAR